MKTARSAPSAFRFDPAVKDALSFIAAKDGRSMANMLEWLIRKHCEREGLGWPPETDVSDAVQPSGRAKASKSAGVGKAPAPKNTKVGKPKA